MLGKCRTNRFRLGFGKALLALSKGSLIVRRESVEGLNQYFLRIAVQFCTLTY